MSGRRLRARNLARPLLLSEDRPVVGFLIRDLTEIAQGRDRFEQVGRGQYVPKLEIFKFRNPHVAKY